MIRGVTLFVMLCVAATSAFAQQMRSSSATPPVAVLEEPPWFGAVVACNKSEGTCWIYMTGGRGIDARIKSDDVARDNCKADNPGAECNTVAVSNRCMHFVFANPVPGRWRPITERTPDGYGYSPDAAQRDCRAAKPGARCETVVSVACGPADYR